MTTYILRKGVSSPSDLKVPATHRVYVGPQAAHIANITETAGTMTTGERQAFNALLVALRGAGVLAAS